MFNTPAHDYSKAEYVQLIGQPYIDWNIQSVAHREDWTSQLPRIPTLLNMTTQQSTADYNVVRLEIRAEDIRFRLADIHKVNIDLQLEKEFNGIVQEWKQETGGESSLSRITGNINYLKVIKLGRPVVPLILRELEKEPAPWFLALRVLTDETAVGREHKGNFAKMAEDWIRWGKDNSII